jgi:lipoate-protein ligase A
MPRSGWQLLREGFPDRPELGPALSRVLLEQVASGERPATVRLSRPGRVVAFGRRDAVAPGYKAAVRAAAEQGFPGMERISGGRAAAFTEGALSLTLTLPDPHPAERTDQRFAEWTGLVRDAFADLGADARIGAVPGEYCPGEYSVNAGGRIKLAGVGQRMIRGAAHIGFVILVSGSELVAETLEPVYGALGLEYRPETVGSLEDAVPGVGREDAERVLLGRLGRAAELEADPGNCGVPSLRVPLKPLRLQ